MQDILTHPPPKSLPEGQAFVVMPKEQFDDLLEYVRRIAEAVERQKPGPREVAVEVDNFGLNPAALFTDQDLQQMLGVSEKTTYRWRKNGLIEYQKGAIGATGSKIWYTGQQIIDFYRRYAVPNKLNKLKPIEKKIPKGHV